MADSQRKRKSVSELGSFALFIAHVINQVSEIVVTGDAGSVCPSGAIQHTKVRYVKAPDPDLGFGKNVNWGFRHTNTRYVLILNDDVFLEATAVASLLEAIQSRPRAGVVGHLLRLPNGKIQHGGKCRSPDNRGWVHLDAGQLTPSLRGTVEIEQVTGASILVDRKAFYEAGAFDEDFHVYAEDDALCLQIRQAGYKVLFTPNAVGTHLEGSTTRGMGKAEAYTRDALDIFWQKWGWYLVKNANTNPGVF